MPRDLNLSQRNLLLDVTLTQQDPGADATSGDFGQGAEAGAPASQLAAPLSAPANKSLASTSTPMSTESTLASDSIAPRPPAILGVQEQIISYQPDGTTKIDLILQIEDVSGAVEYDIRVAKDSGNL